MAAPTTTNEVTVRRLTRLLTGSDGNGGLWGKIKDALGLKANKEDSVYYVAGPNTFTAYSASSTYTVWSSGAYTSSNSCVYSGRAYYCKTAITTPEAWTSSHWTLIPTVEWTGSITGLTAYYTGLKIAYKIPNVTGGNSSTTLNINSLGAKTVYRDTSNTTTHLPAGSVVFLAYDGSAFRWADYDANSTYSGMITAYLNNAGDAAKTATSTNFKLTSGVTILLTNNAANTKAAALTLNVNSTGAKTLYINGAASSSTNYTIPVGTYFCHYDGSYWQLWTDGTAQFKKMKATTLPSNNYSGYAYYTGATTGSMIIAEIAPPTSNYSDVIASFDVFNYVAAAGGYAFRGVLSVGLRRGADASTYEKHAGYIGYNLDVAIKVYFDSATNKLLIGTNKSGNAYTSVKLVLKNSTGYDANQNTESYVTMTNSRSTTSISSYTEVSVNSMFIPKGSGTVALLDGTLDAATIGTSAVDLNTLVGDSQRYAVRVYNWSYTNRGNVSNKPTDHGGTLFVLSYSADRVFQFVLNSSAGLYARLKYENAGTWTSWTNVRDASWINSGTFDTARIPVLPTSRMRWGTGSFNTSQTGTRRLALIAPNSSASYHDAISTFAVYRTAAVVSENKYSFCGYLTVCLRNNNGTYTYSARYTGHSLSALGGATLLVKYSSSTHNLLVFVNKTGTSNVSLHLCLMSAFSDWGGTNNDSRVTMYIDQATEDVSGYADVTIENLFIPTLSSTELATASGDYSGAGLKAATAALADHATYADALPSRAVGNTTTPVYIKSDGTPDTCTTLSLNTTGSAASLSVTAQVGTGDRPVYFSSAGKPVRVDRPDFNSSAPNNGTWGITRTKVMKKSSAFTIDVSNCTSVGDEIVVFNTGSSDYNVTIPYGDGTTADTTTAKVTAKSFRVFRVIIASSTAGAMYPSY